MLRSLRTAERAMQLQQLHIETLANNLANVNSAGFKQVLTQVFQDGPVNAGRAVAAEPHQAITRSDSPDDVWSTQPAPQIQAVLDLRPGTLRTTERATDFAIDGDGYFVVGEDGEELYTRNGSFTFDENRQLVTASGLKVQGTEGPLTVDGRSFSVAEDGTFTVDGNVVGRLKLVRFSQPLRLEHAGGSLFRAPGDLTAEEIPPNEIQIVQAQLEGSNVNPIDTLIDMIAAQRAFEIEAKILQANDETLDRSVNQLGRKA